MTERIREREYDGRLLQTRLLDDRTIEIELERPRGFTFQPGQRILLTLPDGQTSREYSFASGADEPVLRFCIRLIPGGKASAQLAELKVGSRLSFSGPTGYFIHRPSEGQSVFVATGTGITPFVSMAKSGVKGFTLFHGVRRAGELYYRSELERTAREYLPCLSQADANEAAGVKGYAGRVSAALLDCLGPGKRDFYLSGRREMIRDVLLLIDGHFPGSRVYTEPFY